MSSYLLSIIGIVLFCSVLTVIIPKGKTAKIVNGMARLACIVAIVAPIPAYLSEESGAFFGKTSIETDEAFIKYCSELRVDEAAQTLEKTWREEYEKDLSVTLYWGWTEEQEIEIYQANVYHRDLTQEEQTNIATYMQQTCGVQVVFYDDDGQ